MLKWIIDYFYKLIFGPPEDQAIADDKKLIEEKSAETKSVLEHIGELEIERDAKTAEVVVATQEVSKADQARKNAVEATDASMVPVVREEKDISGPDLDAKLKDL